MPTIREQFQKLQDYVNNGKALQAIEELYADEALMIQPDGTRLEGKPAILAFENDFFANVTEVRGFGILDYVINEDAGMSFDISHTDITHKVWGKRNVKQMSVMKWKDGKIIEVRFYEDV